MALRLLASVTAGALLGVSAVGLVAPTPAMAGMSSCRTASAESVNDYMASAQQSGVSTFTIEQTLEREWCLEKVSSDPIGTLANSGPSDVDWYSMSIYYDGRERNYIAVASWQWLNNNFIKDDIVVCANNEVGGEDGVGIRFSGGHIQIIGKSAQAWGNPAHDGAANDYGYLTVPHSGVNDFGVGFRAQDSAKRMQNAVGTCGSTYDYSMWGGTVTITFASLNGCKNTQMYPGYIHTWDSTGVNSIGAGPWSFSIGWTNAGESWEKQENGPTARVC